MSLSTCFRSVAIATALFVAGSNVQAQVTAPALRIEPSMRLRRASDRPAAHEGASISNGDTLLELAARWRVRQLAMFVSFEGSAVSEWFDPQLAVSSYLRAERISRSRMLFTPAGPRKLAIGLERTF